MTTQTSRTLAANQPRNRPGMVLAVACICQLMVVLDVSVVNVALPSIRADLGFTSSSLQWVINAYTLTFGGLLLLGGRLADIFGQRRVALLALLVFALTSLLGGLAQTPGELIAARAAQGVSGAALLPMSLTAITTTFPEGEARHRALAVWGAVAGAGGAIGVLLGGVLTQALDWRWVLFVNLPIAALAIPLVLASLPDRRAERHPRLDLLGATLITLSLLSLVYGVVRTNQYSWGSPHTLVALAIAAILAAGFVIVEQRAAVPLVRFGLLRNRPLLVANIVVFFIACGQFGAFYFASLYLQGVLRYSPIKTGLAFVPFSLGVIVGSTVAGKLVPRLGARLPLLVGLILGAIGMGWFGLISAHGTFLSDMLGPSIVASIGLGACYVANSSAATSGVAPHEAGLASGLLGACRQCGGSIGLAALATVANTTTRSHVTAGIAPAVALTDGYARAFLIVGCLIAVGAITAGLLLPRGTKPGVREAGAHEHAVSEQV